MKGLVIPARDSATVARPTSPVTTVEDSDPVDLSLPPQRDSQPCDYMFTPPQVRRRSRDSKDFAPPADDADERPTPPRPEPRASLQVPTTSAATAANNAVHLQRILRLQNEELSANLEAERNSRAETEEELRLATRQLQQMRSQIQELEQMVVSERQSGRDQRSDVAARQQKLEAEMARQLAAAHGVHKALNGILNRLAYQQASSNAPPIGDVPPPMGEVTIVCCDIDRSAELWELYPAVMSEGVSLYGALVREKMAQHRGYEARSEGDSYTIVFASPANAVRFGTDLQMSMLQLPWPEPILKSWEGYGEHHDDEYRLIWRGLRVRIGACLGQPQCKLDPYTARVTYSGSDLTRAAGITQLAAGGQMLVSANVSDRVQNAVPYLHVRDLGRFSLRGVPEKVQVRLVLPEALQRRKFPTTLSTFVANGIEDSLQQLVRANGELRTGLSTLDTELRTVSAVLRKHEDAAEQRARLEESSVYSELLSALVDRKEAVARLKELEDRMQSHRQASLELQMRLGNLISERKRGVDDREYAAGKRLSVSSPRVRRLSDSSAGLPAAGSTDSFDGTLSETDLADELAAAKIEIHTLRQDQRAAEAKLAESARTIQELQTTLLSLQKQEREQLQVFTKRRVFLEEELSRTQKVTNTFGRQLNTLASRIGFKEADESQRDAQGDPSTDVPAPLGKVALVFTDIQRSTEKWELDPELMQQCLSLHNQTVRSLIKDLDGYEVKTEGDAFMIAFQAPLQAALFALDVQTRLLNVDWPPEALSRWSDCKEERNAKGQLLWRGLRVRVAAHYGQPTCQVDPVSGRMDYLGSMVNRAARIESLAAGGQVFVSAELWNEIKSNMPNIACHDMGAFKLKGMQDSAQIMQLTPPGLGERHFPSVSSSAMSNQLDASLNLLMQENKQLRKHLTDLESELKQIVSFSEELEKKVNFELSPRPSMNGARTTPLSLSTESLAVLMQAASWNQNLGQQVANITSKVSDFREETSQIKHHIKDLVKQKKLLADERDTLLRRIEELEYERAVLLEGGAISIDDARPPTPTPGDRRPSSASVSYEDILTGRSTGSSDDDSSEYGGRTLKPLERTKAAAAVQKRSQSDLTPSRPMLSISRDFAPSPVSSSSADSNDDPEVMRVRAETSDEAVSEMFLPVSQAKGGRRRVPTASEVPIVITRTSQHVLSASPPAPAHAATFDKRKSVDLGDLLPGGRNKPPPLQLSAVGSCAAPTTLMGANLRLAPPDRRKSDPRTAKGPVLMIRKIGGTAGAGQGADPAEADHDERVRVIA